MIRVPAQLKAVTGATLLIIGSAAPLAATAHSEGVEAADPNTPPAVLTFAGAARTYTALHRTRADWRTRFADGEAPMAGHMGHDGHAGGTEPTPSRNSQ